MLESEQPYYSNLSEVKSHALSLDDFLSQVERRAYRTAMLSTRKPADALDIVQDAMMKLVQHYRERPAAEWPLLFQRILQHRIMDWHRQQTRHKKWFWQTASDVDHDTDDEINLVVDEREQDPAELLAQASDIQCVVNALEQLPLRQRQAFMLRAWEGFDVQETAAAMGCGEGSVKTHYFRALQTLREHLGRNT
ncbi:RNA polymerase sigma factor [Cellvibrio zantedeschiae]|uniref:RNA polymerase sigma factor n=1 Tax=Cellvibrio zantedeschiae TaxID=1237077 RepID=A0ABQ3B075_9GAMM|nr:RNA polymerase sigma factor [Cellvibrio zantedeschiae]GGY69884.1 RNA polymerase sigma factor [Cellvibrio zantedeschiae]